MKKLSVLLVVALVAASFLLAGFAKDTGQEALKSQAPQQIALQEPSEKTANPESKPPLHNETTEHKNNKPSEKNTQKQTDKPAPTAQVTEVKVSKEDAKAAALKHAGVNEADVKRYKIEVDRERNATVYEVEFDAGNYEYDYVINVETGKIVHSEVEKKHGVSQANQNQSTTTTKAQPQPVAELNITKDEAKAAALKHAGLKENEVSRFKAELDKERNSLVYEIEFTAGRYEYEYEVSVESGKILKSEKEYID